MFKYFSWPVLLTPSTLIVKGSTFLRISGDGSWLSSRIGIAEIISFALSGSAGSAGINKMRSAAVAVGPPACEIMLRIVSAGLAKLYSPGFCTAPITAT